jgi:DNA-binding NtrC family response regulator
MAESNPKRIFVVDDERVISTTAAMILSNSGYQATAFFSADEAIKAAESECPDILITDLLMPGMSGLELATRIQELCSKCKVVLFHGQANTDDLTGNAYVQGRQFETLAKPIHPVDLLAAIAKL